jgi:hypothetical protein
MRRGLRKNTAVGRRVEASSVIIIQGAYFRGFSIATTHRTNVDMA